MTTIKEKLSRGINPPNMLQSMASGYRRAAFEEIERLEKVIDELRAENARLALIIFDHELADYEGEAAELHAQILEQRRVIESMQPRTIGNVGTACGEYVECSGRPDAPHGVDLEASLRAGKTVCLCASWAPGEAS